jgi:hypothetical protein
LWRHAHDCTASASPLRSPVAILINEVAGGDTMRLRIAIIAACAATFALAQVIPAQAGETNEFPRTSMKQQGPAQQLVNPTRSDRKHQGSMGPPVAPPAQGGGLNDVRKTDIDLKRLVKGK